MNAIETFLSALNAALKDQTFVKMTLSGYAGAEAYLKSLHIKPVLIKREPKLSVTYRYKTRDEVKNLTRHEAFSLFKKVLEQREFRIANLFATTGDWVYEHSRAGKPLLKELPATHKTAPDFSHDEAKNRVLSPDGKPWMIALGLADENGSIFKNAQDKFKQINHFIELLKPHLSRLPKEKSLRIADMGAGKGYLTFALYDYLTTVEKRAVQLTGVELRPELVDLCNKTAQESGFKGLSFQTGEIETFETGELDVLVALHACDTATDDALFKGIQSGAQLIVTAPCCHKQIRKEMETTAVAESPLSFVTRHGVFLERQAEMATDGIRALVMEINGYSTKIVEFVSDIHTPKNVMLISEKRTVSDASREAFTAELANAKQFYGVKTQHLAAKFAL